MASDTLGGDRVLDPARLALKLLAARALLLGAVVALVVPAAASTAVGDDWRAFGRTPDNLRHSPLSEVTRQNVAQLRRAYAIDFQAINPDVRRGQQSYPLAVGGKLFVTTNDGNVFALAASTGRVLWQYKPRNSALSSRTSASSRTAASPSVPGGSSSLRARHEARRAPSERRPRARDHLDRGRRTGRVPNYGYSETSAPVCAGGRIVIGAAGSEYGVRGFVMAYTPDLRRRGRSRSGRSRPTARVAPAARIVGGGVVWTPVTIDARHEHASSSAPAPRRRPSTRRSDPVQTRARTRSSRSTSPRPPQVVAAAAHRGNQWATTSRSRRSSTPPTSAASERRVVSIGTMEGVWFAFDARHRASRSTTRVQVIDRVEHPHLKPGQPSSSTRPRSAGSTTRPRRTTPRPALRLQRRGRDRRGDQAADADADAEAAKLAPRRRVPRARERRLRRGTARLARLRLDQRHRRRHGAARLEDPHARARARRRHDHRDRPRLRRRRRRRTASLRRPRRPRALVVPRPAARSPPAPRSSRVGGKRVHRGHRRRHPDLVGRRHRLRNHGLRLSAPQSPHRRAPRTP